jgi:DNA-binding Lrp family transcriptional regulator
MLRWLLLRYYINEFKLPYRWIASRIALSPNDVQLAVKGLRISGFEGRVDVNVIVNAIKLFREGKVRKS